MTHRGRGPAVRRLALVVTVFGWFLSAAGAVDAHAELDSSDPSANASLPASPETLNLTFTESIDPTSFSVELLDTQQQPVTGLGEPTFAAGDRQASLSLPELGDGVYVVAYDVLSAVDGHVTDGSFAFQVDASGSLPPPSVTPTSDAPAADLGAAVARWVALAAALAAFGALVFWRFSARPALRATDIGPARPTIWLVVGFLGFVGLGALGAFLTLAGRPLETSAGAPHEHFPLDFAGAFGTTSFAMAMRVVEGGMFLTFAIAAWWWIRRDEDRRRAGRDLPEPGSESAVLWVALVLAAVTLAGFSFGGHVGALGGPAFAILDWAHLLAVGCWLGALVGFFVTLVATRSLAADARRAAMAAALRRHSRIALAAAPVVALTGIANSSVVLGASRNLAATDYGDLLLAKAILFAVAIGIGAVNFFLVRRVAVGRLVLTAAAELAVAALAVLTAAGLLTLPTAAARADRLVTVPVATAHLYGAAEDSTLHLIVSVPSPGPQLYQVQAADAASGAPREDLQKVFLLFTPPAGGDLTPQRVEMAPSDLAPGLFELQGTYTPVVGDWTVDVILRRAGVPDTSVSIDLPVSLPSPPERLPPADTGIAAPAPLTALWALLPAAPFDWIVPIALFALAGLAFAVEARRRTPGPMGRAASGLRLAAVLLGVVIALVVGSRALVLSAATPPADAASLTNPIAADADSVARGESAYLANCAACHGSDAGDLVARLGARSDGELFYVVTTGLPGTSMPSFATALTPNDRWDLINYLRR